MLPKNEVTDASDVELLAAVLGNRRTAENPLKQSSVAASVGEAYCAFAA
jgi:hypothetical protein